MKQTLASLLILSAIIAANAQVKPLTFTQTVSADNASKKELYQQGKAWFNDVFKGAGKEIKNENPDQGIIFGKAAFQYAPKVVTWSAKTKGQVSFSLKLTFSEGRYQYEVSNFTHEGSGISFDLITDDVSCNKEIPDATAEWKNEVWADIKAQAKTNTDLIAKSLIATMNKPK